MKRAQDARNLTLVGYIATSYGKRKLEDVQADVDRYVKWYPGIQCIFFDEQASDADHVQYQATLYNYVRNKSGLKLVVTNPGTDCAEQYFTTPATDVACLFEDAKPFDPAKLPDWAAKHSQAVAILPYSVKDPKKMQEIIKVAQEKKLGCCYVTDAEGGNPWDRLPKYWDDEVVAVKAANEALKK